MGERTFVNSAKQSPHKKTGHQLRLPFDMPLLLILIVLLVFGLLMVYSASWDASLLMEEEPTYIFWRQVLWVGLGLAMAFILSLIDYHRYEKLLIPMIIITIGVLFTVVVLNRFRAIPSRSLFGGSIQPAEFAKVAIIIYLSFWLSKRQQVLSKINVGMFPLTVIIGVIAGLIVAQPDISAGATVAVIGVLLFFLAGGDLKQIAIFIVLMLLAGAFVVAISTTGTNRLKEYVTVLQNPVLGSDHIRRSFEAVIKGGFFGVGIGKANTKSTGLPLPHTDSIFAVIAEETGVLGSVFLFILFGLLLWRGLVIARRAPDQLGSLLAFGFVGWIVLEALMNAAVMIGLIPFTGNSLPFFSAGGSSMIACLAGIGIVMNVARQSIMGQETKGRSSSNAVVDLRRRDGRGSVSRADRFRSTKN